MNNNTNNATSNVSAIRDDAINIPNLQNMLNLSHSAVTAQQLQNDKINAFFEQSKKDDEKRRKQEEYNMRIKVRSSK